MTTVFIAGDDQAMGALAETAIYCQWFHDTELLSHLHYGEPGSLCGEVGLLKNYPYCSFSSCDGTATMTSIRACFSPNHPLSQRPCNRYSSKFKPNLTHEKA
jgi:hypothetical protein